MRILRKVQPGVLLYDLLVFGDHFLQRFGVKIGIEFRFSLFLLGVKYFLKFGFRQLQHDAAKHLNEATIGIIGKARVLAETGQCFDAFVVEAEIQNRIHHARHGKLRTRAHADQQWILPFTQLLPLQILQAMQRGIHLAINFRGSLALTHVLAARLGLNREAGRHRQSRIRHLGQTSALAP